MEVKYLDVNFRVKFSLAGDGKENTENPREISKFLPFEKVKHPASPQNCRRDDKALIEWQ